MISLPSIRADAYHNFFYEGTFATADIYDDIVVRFAHGDFFSTTIYSDRFLVNADGYYDPPFEFSFEVNTPFPFHGELRINRTQFDYKGEYFLLYDFSALRPNFIINVNGKYMCLLAVKCMYTYCMSKVAWYVYVVVCLCVDLCVCTISVHVSVYMCV